MLDGNSTCVSEISDFPELGELNFGCMTFMNTGEFVLKSLTNVIRFIRSSKIDNHSNKSFVL